MSNEKRNRGNKIARLLILDSFNKRKTHHDHRYGDNHNFPKTIEQFILELKRDFPKYENFGHALQQFVNPKTSMAKTLNLPLSVLCKLLTEYIINYNESGSNYKEVDVVDKGYLPKYLESSIFKCNPKFFEFMWDEVLYDKYDRWGMHIKRKMWDEILPEVEEKMGDEEWQEENAVSFDSIDQEMGYFFSYWHYPIDNLGWTEDMLCDWYLYEVPNRDIIDYILTEYDDKYIHYLPMWDKNFYLIEKDEVFW